MKRIRQFERTDRDIINAFLTLLDQKSLEKITVDDIAAEAMINRSTFYQHFTDKYAILERLEEMYVNEMTEMVDKIVSGGRLSFDSMDEIIEGYFVKNKVTLKKLISIQTAEFNLQNRIHKLFYTYFKRIFNSLSSLEIEMMTSMFTSFFFYYLDHKEASGKYSRILFDSYEHLTMAFYRMQDIPAAKDAFRTLIDSYAMRN